jgi:hypothetical protein
VHDIAVVMITIERPAPRRNYLPTTLRNFKVVGGFESIRLHSLSISDGGSAGTNWPRRAVHEAGADDFLTRWVIASERIPAARNAAIALDMGLLTGAPWILFCEDDLDFCGDFMDSVGRWLDDHADPAFHLFPFGAAYPQVAVRAAQGAWTWKYPVTAFYGFQCVAMRREDAILLSAFWHLCAERDEHRFREAIDMSVQDWHQSNYPDQKFFLASAPSFVQHIGRDSLATSKKETHTFETFPGKFWVYEEGVVRA